MTKPEELVAAVIKAKKTVDQGYLDLEKLSRFAVMALKDAGQKSLSEEIDRTLFLIQSGKAEAVNLMVDVNRYGLVITFNPPGFHRITVELTKRGKGVIKESTGNDLQKLVKDVADYAVTDVSLG